MDFTFSRVRRRAWLMSAVVLIAALSGGWETPAQAENPSQLWLLLQRCAAQAQAGVQPPRPCTRVSGQPGTADSFAVLKDRDGKAQYLLLPLQRTSGIEAASLQNPHAHNFMAEAWALRPLVEQAAGGHLSRQNFGLVVNSAYGRSQDQLHIHADCMAPWLVQRLSAQRWSRDTDWHALDLPLDGGEHHFQIRWLPGARLQVNPFQLLAQHLAAGDQMANHSLVLIGGYDAHRRPGFFLLSGKRDVASGDNANADRLQDMRCQVLRTASST